MVTKCRVIYRFVNFRIYSNKKFASKTSLPNLRKSERRYVSFNDNNDENDDDKEEEEEDEDAWKVYDCFMCDPAVHPITICTSWPSRLKVTILLAKFGWFYLHFRGSICKKGKVRVQNKVVVRRASEILSNPEDAKMLLYVYASIIKKSPFCVLVQTKKKYDTSGPGPIP